MGEIHTALCYAMLGLAAVTFIALLFIRAPYGRHLRPGFGPVIPARVGWIAMELPAVVVFAATFLGGRHAAETTPILLLAFWQLHYLHRTFVYPFRLSPRARPMPILVVGLGFGFQLLNSWLNAHQIAELGTYRPQWLGDPRFVVGAGLFAVGLVVNHRADATLLRLRRAGSGYVIPRGGLFERVTSPNYFGELLEWTGWAVMTWSLAGLAFAVYTFANLVPRALHHRRWYRERFPDYPENRRAILPFLL